MQNNRPLPHLPCPGETLQSGRETESRSLRRERHKALRIDANEYASTPLVNIVDSCDGAVASVRHDEFMGDYWKTIERFSAALTDSVL